MTKRREKIRRKGTSIVQENRRVEENEGEQRGKQGERERQYSMENKRK